MITVKFLLRLRYRLNPANAICIKAISKPPLDKLSDYFCRLSTHVNLSLFGNLVNRFLLN